MHARRREPTLDGEIFCSLREAQIVIESWRSHYNRIRPALILASTFNVAVLPGTSPLDIGGLCAASPNPSCTASATNSGPLWERM